MNNASILLLLTEHIASSFPGLFTFPKDRSSASALALWQSMPAVYQQGAVIYSDHWEAYQTVLPSKRHYAVGKKTGWTSYIERFNNTLRQ